MIELKDVSRHYVLPGQTIKALDHLTLTIPDGSFTALAGPSGSGKSTLLNILAGYDRPQEGEYLYDHRPVRRFSEKELAAFHRWEVGMVFQSFHLLPNLDLYENLALPLFYQRRRASRDDLDRCLALVGLTGCGKKRPSQLSGGQQQRAAIARMLAARVRVILADEPTGSLDPANAAQIMAIFRKLNLSGTTIVMVTHDEACARCATRIIRLRDGHVAA